ncbi:MAG: DNA cytosine methyltransferase [Bacteroidetes bacterium]|nr:DNA cytosine methyltransferase [Bacteroidota bacterium]
MHSEFKFIDLFCGIGGFHTALSRMGGKCVFASDIDKECQKTYFENYKISPVGDITKVDETEIPDFDVLCGGFPCQSFSKAGNRKGIEDPRGTLFFDILRIAKHHKPKYMILENVRNLAKHDNGRTWQIIHSNLLDIGYSVSETPIIFSPHYIGIPQHRERVFILCQREDLGDVPKFEFEPDKTVKCSIDDVLLSDELIPNIEKYKLSTEQIKLIEIWNEFAQKLVTPLPGFPVWADRLKELDVNEDLESLPAWKRNFILKNHYLYKDNLHFIEGWLKKAYTLPNFKGSKAMFEWQAGKTENPNIWETIMHFRPSGLRVKKPDYFPALVAITQTSIIGSRRRVITPREGARIQSFPDNFILNEKDSIAYKQLGNSVNVKVVELFARFLLENKSFNPNQFSLKRKKSIIKQTQQFIEFT